jgi:alkaline phosphatase
MPRLLLVITLWLLGGTAILPAAETARYVFLFIGDGMGPAQVAAATAALPVFAPTRQELFMTGLPVHGTCTTHSANAAITDSAAAGTALACGVKTTNGTIAMDRTGAIPLPSIAEQAKAAGRRVGIISSVSIDHATPACFYAHGASRNDYWDIAQQLAPSGFDFFGGGGFWGALPDKRREREDPLAMTLAANYRLVQATAELANLTPGAGRILAIHPRTSTRDASMPWVLESLPGEPTLADFTAAGISALDGPAGFFLMVEGGKIDWACHANDLASCVTETLAFDDAIGVACTFAANHPGETLIVVTADHETGGLAPLADTAPRMEPLRAQILAKDAARERVAVASAGAADPLAAVLPVLREIFGLTELDPTDLEALRQAATAPAGERHLVVTATALRILSTRAGWTWSSLDHTATPVPLYAAGVSAERFRGEHDNTDLARLLSEMMGLPAPTTP